MRLLIVGMHNSPHLHRWVRMVARPTDTILIFPVLAFEAAVPEDFVEIGLEKATSELAPGIWLVRPLEARSPDAADMDQRAGYVPLTHGFVSTTVLSSADRLSLCIDLFRPDILHGMETQIAGYLCAETARRRRGFPPWIQSTWGSDLRLYRHMPGHAQRLRGVFERVQVHLADCRCDREAARAFGYKGQDMPIIPSSGGMDVDAVNALAQVPPSRRRTIVVKGYHNWAGRGLLALSALLLAADRLDGYSVEILAASQDVRNWAEIASQRSGLAIRVSDYFPSHWDALARLATARIVIGLSISDGLPTTVLEAMTVGAFPIQSSAGCASEWFRDGTTGFEVDVNDTRAVADAIVRAATDDALVDRAAEENLQIVRRSWNPLTNATLAWRVYDLVRAGRCQGDAA